MQQLDFFAVPSALPEGFRYQDELINREQEARLIERVRELPFKEFEFHGYVGKRRTVSFGLRYDYDAEDVRPAAEMPGFLQPLRDAAAKFAGFAPERVRQVLVSEYSEGAGIGWHRDKGVFGEIIGVSLGSACKFRLRRARGDDWERVTIDAEPRSVYLLSGPARTEWEHSIPGVDTPRYSVTFRTLR